MRSLKQMLCALHLFLCFKEPLENLADKSQFGSTLNVGDYSPKKYLMIDPADAIRIERTYYYFIPRDKQGVLLIFHLSRNK